jgi:hypothetical protein
VAAVEVMAALMRYVASDSNAELLRSGGATAQASVSSFILVQQPSDPM